MNPATLLIAEAPPAQLLPAEPTLAAQPDGLAGGKPFARIMEGTATDVPAEPVPRKNEQEGDGAAKKNDTVLATMMNIPVSAMVAMPVLPVLACGQTSTMVKAEILANPEACLQIQNSGLTVHESDPTASVAVIGPAISNGTAKAELPEILPSAVPAPVVLPVARVSTNSSSESGTMRADSRPSAAENVIEQQRPQLLEGESPLVLPANQIEPDQLSVLDGTVIAKQDDGMKKDVKADKSSTLAEKTLPLGNFSTIAKVEATRPSRNKEAFSEASTEPAESSRESVVPNEKPTTVYGTAMAEFKHFDLRISTDGAGVDGVRAPQVEKVFNGISEQAVTFRKVGVDSMDAVLRPDRGTEISLHLTVGNNGQVEVVARVERGNFEGLQTQWSELQSSLALRGVRVGELQQSSLNNQTSSHSSLPHLAGTMDGQHQSQRQTSHSPKSLDEPLSLGSMTGRANEKTSTSRPTRSRGWEKWA